MEFLVPKHWVGSQISKTVLVTSISLSVQVHKGLTLAHYLSFFCLWWGFYWTAWLLFLWLFFLCRRCLFLWVNGVWWSTCIEVYNYNVHTVHVHYRTHSYALRTLGTCIIQTYMYVIWMHMYIHCIHVHVHYVGRIVITSCDKPLGMYMSLHTCTVPLTCKVQCVCVLHAN